MFAVPLLEERLESSYGHFLSGWPFVLSRVLNGPIQFGIYCFFFAFLFCRSARLRVFVESQQSFLDFGQDADEVGISEESRKVDELSENFVGRWKIASPVLSIRRGALSAMSSRRKRSQGDVTGALDSFASLEEKHLRSSRFFLLFLASTLVPLGFLGTVIGIPSALLEIGEVLARQPGQQQTSITAVSLDLAFAFDTTAIGLLLTIPTRFLAAQLVSDEDEVIQRAQRQCLSKYVL